jgi:hypothetical protein
MELIDLKVGKDEFGLGFEPDPDPDLDQIRYALRGRIRIWSKPQSGSPTLLSALR